MKSARPDQPKNLARSQSNRQATTRLCLETGELRLGMARVVYFHASWEKSFAAALPAACQGCTARFRFHAGTKTMLTFACSLGWLVSAFHKTENRFGAI
jgi:hypothetical protein